jgi:hypothetical protein
LVDNRLVVGDTLFVWAGAQRRLPALREGRQLLAPTAGGRYPEPLNAQPPSGRELPLRIVLVHPPTGVVFQLQRGRTDLVPPIEATGDLLGFELTVRVAPGEGGAPNFLGPFAQGPSAGRFVYVNSGDYGRAGGAYWARRAKVPLTSITWARIEQAFAAPDLLLETRISGAAGDDAPGCATVRLLDGGWEYVRGSKSVRGEPQSKLAHHAKCGASRRG